MYEKRGRNMRQRVIIIGAGFGGLYAARELANTPVEVLLIDRKNYHTFTPLLYQVATCGLDPSEIAYPVRSIFYDKPNVHFRMGEVLDIDLEHQEVRVRANGQEQTEAYDYLIVAAGSVTNFFGNQALEQTAFSLKDVSEAVDVRNHVLRLFEKAAWTDDEAECRALTTLVVVGGGPTGLETAGALHELYNYVLRKEYGDLEAHVVLVEALDRLLLAFPEPLQAAAYRQLTDLGVEVILGNAVAEAGEDYIRLQDGREIRTRTIIWSAGVKASPLAAMLNVELQRGGRIPVDNTMAVAGHTNIYAVGDIAYLEDAEGMPYPQLIPVAKQQGHLAAHNILRRIRGEEPSKFDYQDRGIMATIGRSRAVAWIYNRIPLTGFIAWMMWLVLHLITLLGFRNRASVFVGWMWNYLTYDRSVRIILEQSKSRSDSW
jgi:NADH:ubiquinone reductase (H+-translocating)